MDYKKIGSYIATKRKKLNYTQKDLADKLCLTDRAISRWERGIGCPDIGILEELANILNVSVLEILHGEDIKNNEEQNKSVVKLIKEEKKKTNKIKAYFMLSLNILLILILLLTAITINIGYKMNKSDQYIQIVSDSMRPDIKIGDIVKLKKVNNDDQLSIGDIITFYVNDNNSNQLFITHRIVNKYEVDNTGKTFYTTKGDFNVNNDSSIITLDNIVGKVEKKVNFNWFFQNKYMLMFLLLLFYIIILIDIYVGIIFIKTKVIKNSR